MSNRVIILEKKDKSLILIIPIRKKSINETEDQYILNLCKESNLTKEKLVGVVDRKELPLMSRNNWRWNNKSKKVIIKK